MSVVKSISWQQENYEIIKTPVIYSVSGENHRSWTPPRHLSWGSSGPQHGSEVSQKWVLMRSYMWVARKLDFSRMSLTKSLFLLFHGPPKMSLEPPANEILALNTLIKWSLVWNLKKWSKKVTRKSWVTREKAWAGPIREIQNQSGDLG